MASTHCTRSSRCRCVVARAARLTTQRGIPVATVAIGNGTNAGLLAVRILGASIPRYRLALDAYARELATQVEGKRTRMAETGWEKYKP